MSLITTINNLKIFIERDPNGSKSKTQFVELNETIPVGVTSDGTLVDPEDDEALYVEDHEILLDCSDIFKAASNKLTCTCFLVTWDRLLERKT